MRNFTQQLTLATRYLKLYIREYLLCDSLAKQARRELVLHHHAHPRNIVDLDA